MENQKIIETSKLNNFLKKLGIEIYGIADMTLLKEMATGIPIDLEKFINIFPYAIVLGAQYGKLGKKASGNDVALFLEEAAFHVMTYLEKKGYRYLIIHTEDEFDPINRWGFIYLKALAKGAGLGWQGKSLLIISPEYGPLHRLIAILTDLPLQSNQIITNRCDDCQKCIKNCPQNALTYSDFNDHPIHRDDVLDVNKCIGDNGCMVCILSCPFLVNFTRNTTLP